MWNKNYIHDYTGVCRVQYGKKFLSLEKFYTNIVTGVSDYYEVWVWDGLDGNLCVGLFYEHHFAMLIMSL